MCGGIPYILGYYVALFIEKIGSKIDCVYARKCIMISQFYERNTCIHFSQ